jgi:hypothetical protein
MNATVGGHMVPLKGDSLLCSAVHQHGVVLEVLKPAPADDVRIAWPVSQTHACMLGSLPRLADALGPATSGCLAKAGDSARFAVLCAKVGQKLHNQSRAVLQLYHSIDILLQLYCLESLKVI